MTENRARAVEEPVGYDYPATDPIPVPGDLPDDRADAPPAGEVVTEPAAPVSEPVTPMESAGTREFPPGSVTGTGKADKAPDFFADAEVDRFRDRWRELQAGFVDDPAQAVRGADDLVDEIIRELAERKEHLGDRWRDGPDGPVGTEELRVVIREYRAFFDRLLNA